MDLKTIILVVILAVFLGIALFFGINLAKGTPVSLAGTAFAGMNETAKVETVATPTPKPTVAPLPEGANLVEEIQKIEMPDFAPDYQSLRNQINN